MAKDDKDKPDTKKPGEESPSKVGPSVGSGEDSVVEEGGTTESGRRKRDERRSKKPRRKRVLKVSVERRSSQDRRDGKDRRSGGSRVFDQRWLRRQRSPIKTFLENFGVYLSFGISLSACLVAMAIPGPALINRIPLKISTQQVYRCSCGSCMADSTDIAPIDEPEEEETTLAENTEEGEGEKEKKKKKDPFAGLLMTGASSGPAVKVKFSLAGRQAVPSVNTKQDIVVGGN